MGGLRHPVFRTRKYDAKLDPTVISARFAAHRDTMVEQEEAVFAELAEMERKAKIVLNNLGISVIETPFYLDFVRECYRIGKRHAEQTRINEVYFHYQKWLLRGLTGSVLTSLALLCGTDLSMYPT